MALNGAEWRKMIQVRPQRFGMKALLLLLPAADVVDLLWLETCTGLGQRL